MWRWRGEHVLAWAICLGAVLCPRALWDRVRLPLTEFAHDEPAARPTGREGVDVAALEAEVARLRSELIASQQQAIELAHDIALSVTLAAAVRDLPAASALPVRVHGAATAAAGASARAGRVRLDAGLRERVPVQAPLAVGAALVGRVTGVADRTSEAELLTATTFRARCRNVRTGAEGLVRGAGAGEMRFRPDGADADLRAGDAIVTSPFSTFAPGGLAVGLVTGTDRDPATGLVEAKVAPAADLGHVKRALVLLGREAER